jgi:hypothetical protein
VKPGPLLAVLVCLLAVLPLAAEAASIQEARPARTPFLIGVDDDHSKWLARPDGLVAKYRDLGLDAVRITIPWRRGQTRPTRLTALYIHRAAQLHARGQRVILAVFGRPSDAPTDAKSRQAYCDFLHHIFVRVPFHDAIIWNEANSPHFWPRKAGPRAYEALLATCWQRLHALRQHHVNVISTTAAHYDPAGFIRRVGEAYSDRKRNHPIVDTFGHNPYPDYASEPPWVQHSDPKTVAQGDLQRLLNATYSAFAGTAQPVPGQGTTTVWYLETGFQTIVHASKRRFYRGQETDRSAVHPLAPHGSPAWMRDQASQIRDALLLARCQPTVGAFFNFELLDEDRLAGWQSGVLWRDGTHKESYDAFKAAVALVESGEVDCSKVPGAGGPLPPAPPTRE